MIRPPRPATREVGPLSEPESDASSTAISTIARNVRALRTEHEWSLDELAGRSNVSKGMLVQIEQNRTNPSIGILSRIAEAFGVSLAALVELDQSPTVRLVSPDEAVELWHGAEGSFGRLLIGSDRREHVELWEWRMVPGDAYPRARSTCPAHGRCSTSTRARSR